MISGKLPIGSAGTAVLKWWLPESFRILPLMNADKRGSKRKNKGLV
jgi:hypothetical protein